MPTRRSRLARGNIFSPLGKFLTVTTLGDLTAGAINSAAPFFEERDERAEWEELEKRLRSLDMTRLRALVDLKEPVIPKIKLLTQWRPQLMKDETVRIVATAVLAERIAADERSHGRTLAWIGVIAGLVSGLVSGFLLGLWAA